MNEEYPVMRIEWWDHWCTNQHDSYTLEEVAQQACRLVRETIGYLVYEDKFMYGIANTIEQDGTVCEVNFLFKKLIKNKVIYGVNNG